MPFPGKGTLGSYATSIVGSAAGGRSRESSGTVSISAAAQVLPPPRGRSPTRGKSPARGSGLPLTRTPRSSTPPPPSSELRREGSSSSSFALSSAAQEAALRRERRRALAMWLAALLRTYPRLLAEASAARSFLAVKKCASPGLVAAARAAACSDGDGAVLAALRATSWAEEVTAALEAHEESIAGGSETAGAVHFYSGFKLDIHIRRFDL